MKNGCKPDCGRRFYIGKMGVSVVTMAEAMNLVNDQVCRGASAYICVANVCTTVLSQRDPEFCKIQNESLLTIPDGMPLVWCAKLGGVQRLERITGIDLMLKVLELSSQMGYSHYFYGDTQQTLLEVTRIVRDRYPAVPIKGMYSPPFRPLTNDELDHTVEEINRLKPTFVWIALGGPKQERWMGRIIQRIDASILVGTGAAFRVFTGYYSRPCLAIQKCGLEGLFWRFRQEPVNTILWYFHYAWAFAPLLLGALARRFCRR